MAEFVEIAHLIEGCPTFSVFRVEDVRSPQSSNAGNIMVSLWFLFCVRRLAHWDKQI